MATTLLDGIDSRAIWHRPLYKASTVVLYGMDRYKWHRLLCCMASTVIKAWTDYERESCNGVPLKWKDIFVVKVQPLFLHIHPVYNWLDMLITRTS